MFDDQSEFLLTDLDLLSRFHMDEVEFRRTEDAVLYSHVEFFSTRGEQY